MDDTTTEPLLVMSPEAHNRGALKCGPVSYDLLTSVGKNIYSGFPKETPELKFRLSSSSFFSFSHGLHVLNTHARRFDSLMRAWCNGGRRKVYAVEDQHIYCV